MKTLISALLFALMTAALPAHAADPAPGTPQAVQTFLSQWQVTSEQLRALMTNPGNDPARARLLVEYHTALSSTGSALNQMLALLGTPTSDPRLVQNQFDILKMSLAKMQTLQNQLKPSDAAKKKASELFTLLTNVLKQQQAITANALQAIRR